MIISEGRDLGCLLFSISSWRAANREIGGNSAHEKIKQLIPELSTIPHADTLARLLERIDTDELESCYENTIIEFIKSKTFGPVPFKQRRMSCKCNYQDLRLRAG